MEVITFTKDTVLSDVHVRTQQKRHLMVRLNRVGQPVFQTHFKILWQNNNLKSASEDCVIITDNEDTENRCKEELLFFKAPTLCGIQTVESFLDEDGDLEVQRKPQSPDKDNAKNYARDMVCPTILTIGSEGQIEEEKFVNNKDVIKIEHTMATPLEDVGKQIWRGAFILADYILSQQDLFRGCTALELGAGTGFTSIIMATVAKTVYCTDVGDDLLEMCERNVSLNRSFMEQAGGQIKVKELDWLKNQFGTVANIYGPNLDQGTFLSGVLEKLLSFGGPCFILGCDLNVALSPSVDASSDPENLYNWTEDDISHFYDETTVIFAADVFYDDDLTDALFKTLSRITQSLRKNCIIYFSMERRYNFTLRYMDITCDAYNHFRNCLNNFETAKHGKQRWSAQEIKLMFPQFFIYEREHLELWKITATPLA